jgi:hypothetical protein
MNQPPTFTSLGLNAIAVRIHESSLPKDTPPTTLDLIPWSRFVIAVWDLAPGWKMHGEIPEGVPPQQFWVRVMRAAHRMGGAVKVVTRGRRFWVWTVKRGDAYKDHWSRKVMDQVERADREGTGIVVLNYILSHDRQVLLARGSEKRRKRHLRFGVLLARDGNKVSTIEWVGDRK